MTTITDLTLTTSPEAPSTRAAARAAKVAAAERAAAEVAELVRGAAEYLADLRAGVEGRSLSGAVQLAVGVAARRVEGARVRGLLGGVVRVIPDSAAWRAGPKVWARQGGGFLRDGSELTVGSYAVGIAGKPSRTSRYYVLLRVGDRIAEVDTAAEVAGELAAAELGRVWGEIERAADAIERAEVAL